MSKILASYFIISVSLNLVACQETPQPERRQAVVEAFEQDRIAQKAMSYEFPALLEARRFDELDNQVASLQQAYERGANEFAVISAYLNFSLSDERYSQYFDEWVAHNHGAWNGRLARGIHHVAVAWEKRGTKYISDTPKEQIDQMDRHFAIAKEDINAALKQEPRAIVGYSMLLQIARGGGTEQDKQRAIDGALKVSPATYYVRWQHMVGLEPKWGGSMRRLRAFAQDSQKWRDQNPRLYALLGYEQEVRANREERDEQYGKAVEYYTEALKYAPVGSWLRSRAWCLRKLNRLNEANRDLSALLETHPDDVDVLIRRADIYINMGHDQSAIPDLERALELNPSSELASNNLGWIFAKQGDNERAANYYDNTLKHNPDSVYALTSCGAVRERLGQLDKAEICLLRALELAPQDALVWRNYGDVLYKRGEPKHLDALANYLKYADREQEKDMYERIRKYLIEQNYQFVHEQQSSPISRKSAPSRDSGHE